MNTEASGFQTAAAALCAGIREKRICECLGLTGFALDDK